MLVLARRVGESIHIGNDIIIEIESFENGNRVKIGINAPKDLRILRSELLQPSKPKQMAALDMKCNDADL